MLIDTDVIIFYMRGNKNARELITSNQGFKISVVTYIELVQGMRNKHELLALRKALKSWLTTIIYIDHEISSKAMFFVEQFYLSHSMELADALIAATSVSTGTPLLTGNFKHYKMIHDLDATRFNPD